MNQQENESLEAFAKWLATLNEDAVALASLLTATSIPDRARRYVVGSLHYLTKSLDLIPDGVEELGYLDDAFVFRIAGKLAIAEAPQARQADIRGLLSRLADEVVLVERTLGADYPRLEKYVRGLQTGAARGRTVDEVMSESRYRSELVAEVQTWAKQYQTPKFSHDEKNLIMVRAYLSEKLP